MKTSNASIIVEQPQASLDSCLGAHSVDDHPATHLLTWSGPLFQILDKEQFHPQLTVKPMDGSIPSGKADNDTVLARSRRDWDWLTSSCPLHSVHQMTSKVNLYIHFPFARANHVRRHSPSPETSNPNLATLSRTLT